MLIKNTYLFALLCVLSLSCTRNYEVTTPSKYLKNIDVASLADSSKYQKLSTVFPFEWDRMVVLQPYQHPLLKDCGYQFNLPDTRIENTEGLQEYLFVKDTKLIKHLIYDGKVAYGIQLLVDKSLYNDCGLKNSSDLYVKYKGDNEFGFIGKTFVIVKK